MEDFKRTTKEDVYMATLNQARILNAIKDIAGAWLLICAFILWQDKEVDALSIIGGTFIFCGLFLFIEIFAVFNYITRKVVFKGVMAQRKKKSQSATPDKKMLLMIAWISNCIWFPVMYISCDRSLDLMKLMLRLD